MEDIVYHVITFLVNVDGKSIIYKEEKTDFKGIDTNMNILYSDDGFHLDNSNIYIEVGHLINVFSGFNIMPMTNEKNGEVNKVISNVKGQQKDKEIVFVIYSVTGVLLIAKAFRDIRVRNPFRKTLRGFEVGDFVYVVGNEERNFFKIVAKERNGVGCLVEVFFGIKAEDGGD